MLKKSILRVILPITIALISSCNPNNEDVIPEEPQQEVNQDDYSVIYGSYIGESSNLTAIILMKGGVAKRACWSGKYGGWYEMGTWNEQEQTITFSPYFDKRYRYSIVFNKLRCLFFFDGTKRLPRNSSDLELLLGGSVWVSENNDTLSFSHRGHSLYDTVPDQNYEGSGQFTSWYSILTESHGNEVQTYYLYYQRQFGERPFRRTGYTVYETTRLASKHVVDGVVEYYPDPSTYVSVDYSFTNPYDVERITLTRKGITYTLDTFCKPFNPR